MRLTTAVFVLVAVVAVVATMAGCGQKGSLYQSTEPAAANRATLPETLRPGSGNPTSPSGAKP